MEILTADLRYPQGKETVLSAAFIRPQQANHRSRERKGARKPPIFDFLT